MYEKFSFLLFYVFSNNDHRMIRNPTKFLKKLYFHHISAFLIRNWSKVIEPSLAQRFRTVNFSSMSCD